jgi:sn-glycerol 3-phosphate transport system substrate-binding protein
MSIGPVTALQAQVVTLRHNLEGAQLNALGDLVVRFNDEQKGRGRIQLQSLPEPEDRRHLPQLALLDTSNSREFFDTLPRFMPLHELMQAAGEKLESRSLFPQIADAVDDGAGRLRALPLALSLPVLYLNRPMLRRAGLDPDQAPKTWLDLQAMAGKLLESGIACPLTSSDFSWVHLENLASQHDQPIALRSGTVERMMVNNLINIKHLALLASWQKSSYFHYAGSGREGDAKFLSGECAMLTGDSALYATALARNIEVSILPLPYYDDVYGARPADLLPDGASLFALAGLKKLEILLSARFVRFLMRPEIQREWVHTTTFLPMTPGALQALRESQAFPLPLLNAAQRRLGAPSAKSTRPRSGAGRERLRTVLGEELEPVWNSNRPAKEALDLTAQRANALGAPQIKPR